MTPPGFIQTGSIISSKNSQALKTMPYRDRRRTDHHAQTGSGRLLIQEESLHLGLIPKSLINGEEAVMLKDFLRLHYTVRSFGKNSYYIRNDKLGYD
jgi:hypothetical protein